MDTSQSMSVYKRIGSTMLKRYLVVLRAATSLR